MPRIPSAEELIISQPPLDPGLSPGEAADVHLRIGASQQRSLSGLSEVGFGLASLGIAIHKKDEAVRRKQEVDNATAIMIPELQEAFFDARDREPDWTKMVPSFEAKANLIMQRRQEALAAEAESEGGFLGLGRGTVDSRVQIAIRAKFESLFFGYRMKMLEARQAKRNSTIKATTLTVVQSAVQVASLSNDSAEVLAMRKLIVDTITADLAMIPEAQALLLRQSMSTIDKAHLNRVMASNSGLAHNMLKAVNEDGSARHFVNIIGNQRTVLIKNTRNQSFVDEKRLREQMEHKRKIIHREHNAALEATFSQWEAGDRVENPPSHQVIDEMLRDNLISESQARNARSRTTDLAQGVDDPAIVMEGYRINRDPARTSEELSDFFQENHRRFGPARKSEFQGLVEKKDKRDQVFQLSIAEGSKQLEDLILGPIKNQFWAVGVTADARARGQQQAARNMDAQSQYSQAALILRGEHPQNDLAFRNALSEAIFEIAERFDQAEIVDRITVVPKTIDEQGIKKWLTITDEFDQNRFLKESQLQLDRLIAAGHMDQVEYHGRTTDLTEWREIRDKQAQAAARTKVLLPKTVSESKSPAPVPEGLVGQVGASDAARLRLEGGR